MGKARPGGHGAGQVPVLASEQLWEVEPGREIGIRPAVRTNSICNNKLHLYSSLSLSRLFQAHLISTLYGRWKRERVYVFTGEPLDHSVQDFPFTLEENGACNHTHT